MSRDETGRQAEIETLAALIGLAEEAISIRAADEGEDAGMVALHRGTVRDAEDWLAALRTPAGGGRVGAEADKERADICAELGCIDKPGVPLKFLQDLRRQLSEANARNLAMRERCLKAALGASYGPPSSWPGEYPKGWRHPPAWGPDEKPTPTIAAWHDNGARDAWFAIRALPTDTTPPGSPDADGTEGRR